MRHYSLLTANSRQTFRTKAISSEVAFLLVYSLQSH